MFFFLWDWLQDRSGRPPFYRSTDDVTPPWYNQIILNDDQKPGMLMLMLGPFSDPRSDRSVTMNWSNYGASSEFQSLLGGPSQAEAKAEAKHLPIFEWSKIREKKLRVIVRLEGRRRCCRRGRCRCCCCCCCCWRIFFWLVHSVSVAIHQFKKESPKIESSYSSFFFIKVHFTVSSNY